jgi:rSAM/selenodomain-associated transferase 2
LNAAGTLPAALAALGPELVREIVIADGGSTDGTVAIANSVGALVTIAQPGRGTQLAAGAGAAAGKWLLFLHADCRLEPGWAEAAAAFIARPEAASCTGYFDFALDDPNPAARRLECIVAWRCRILALPYGDQGLLISRDLYDAIGGFALLPLMEDVELARRLGRRRLARIGGRAVSSAARYRRDGYWLRSLRNVFCLALYLAGVAPARIVRIYG